MSDDVYLMLVDGKVVPVDLGPMLRRHRAAHVKARADAITELSAALAEECFDPETVWDTSTLPDGLKNAAADVTVALLEIERLCQ